MGTDHVFQPTTSVLQRGPRSTIELVHPISAAPAPRYARDHWSGAPGRTHEPHPLTIAFTTNSVVGVAGVEPAPPGLRVRCSASLSYAPTCTYFMFHGRACTPDASPLSSQHWRRGGNKNKKPGDLAAHPGSGKEAEREQALELPPVRGCTRLLLGQCRGAWRWGGFVHINHHETWRTRNPPGG